MLMFRHLALQLLFLCFFCVFFSHSKSYSKKEIEGEEKYDLGEKAPREEI